MAKQIILRTAAVLAILLVGAFVFLVAGAVVTGDASCSAGLPSGRTVSARGHTICVGIESSNTTAIVRTMRHEVVVAPTSVTVDGSLAGSIPASTKSVDVQFDWTGINVYADGQLVDSSKVSTAAVQRPAVR